MSTQAPIRRITAPQITARKGGEPIVSLTSYHAHTAAIVDRYADFILVGDSLGMVMHGMESTVPVPLDLMIMHGRAVVRGTKQALIVVDMPFGTYEESADRVPKCRPHYERNKLWCRKLEVVPAWPKRSISWSNAAFLSWGTSA